MENVHEVRTKNRELAWQPVVVLVEIMHQEVDLAQQRRRKRYYAVWGLELQLSGDLKA